MKRLSIFVAGSICLAAAVALVAFLYGSTETASPSCADWLRNGNALNTPMICEASK